MSDTPETKSLRIALYVVGVIFIVGLFPLTILWPDGFMWEPRQAEYEQMILGTFAVLGVFLLMAAHEPWKHWSLIAFTAWSSLVHGGTMAVQALRDSTETANLYGDVAALVLIGAVLLALLRRAQASQSTA